MKLVVIGNGMASVKLCEELLSYENSYDITVVGEEREAAYDRIRLGERLVSDKCLALKKEEWYRKNGIKLILNEKVVSVDREGKVLLCRSGKKISYDKIVFATGSTAIVPNIEGLDLPGVYTFRTVNDAETIKKKLSDKPHIVVVGGGLLGIETAARCLDAGSKVSVIERSPHLMPMQLDEVGAALLQKQLSEKGLDVYCSQEVKLLKGQKGVEKVILSDMDHIDADMVIFAIGVRPRDELAGTSNLKIAAGGGIEVNEKLQTSDPDIYAIGECVSFQKKKFGIIEPVYRMAEVLAANLNGCPGAFHHKDNAVFLKLAGVPLASYGNVKQDGLVKVERDDSLKKYSRCIYDDDGKLTAAVFLGDTTDFSKVLASKAGICKTSCSNSDLLICQCEAVSQSQLLKFKTAKQAMNETNAGTNCGSCKQQIEEVFGSKPKLINVNKMNRQLHLWASMACCFLLLFFSFTGFLMNHPEAVGLNNVDFIDTSLNLPESTDYSDTAKIINTIKNKINANGYIDNLINEDSTLSFSIRRPGETHDVEVDLDSGEVQVNSEKSSFMNSIAQIHTKENISKRGGTLFIDISAILFTVVSLSGMGVWAGGSRLKLSGAIIIILSLVSLTVYWQYLTH